MIITVVVGGDKFILVSHFCTWFISCDLLLQDDSSQCRRSCLTMANSSVAPASWVGDFWRQEPWDGLFYLLSHLFQLGGLELQLPGFLVFYHFQIHGDIGEFAPLSSVSPATKQNTTYLRARICLQDDASLGFMKIFQDEEFPPKTVNTEPLARFSWRKICKRILPLLDEMESNFLKKGNSQKRALRDLK